jgi:hypothetical protein
MSKSLIDIGSSPNDGAGDSLRVAGQKINSNFNEIYNTFGNGTQLAAIVDLSGPWIETSTGIHTSSNVGIGTTIANYLLDVEGGIEINLPASSPPTGPRDMTFEFLNNTTLKINVMGDDNVIRSANISLS